MYMVRLINNLEHWADVSCATAAAVLARAATAAAPACHHAAALPPAAIHAAAAASAAAVVEGEWLPKECSSKAHSWYGN